MTPETQTLTAPPKPPAHPPAPSGTGEAPRPGAPWWPLLAILLVWAVVSLVDIPMMSAFIELSRLAVGKAADSSVPLMVGLQIATDLLLAFLVFSFAKRFSPPAWYWLAAPVGYLLGQGLYQLPFLVLPPLDLGTATIVALVCGPFASAAGAFLALRRRRPSAEV
jgi:hypothetical protein